MPFETVHVLTGFGTAEKLIKTLSWYDKNWDSNYTPRFNEVEL